MENFKVQAIKHFVGRIRWKENQGLMDSEFKWYWRSSHGIRMRAEIRRVSGYDLCVTWRRNPLIFNLSEAQEENFYWRREKLSLAEITLFLRSKATCEPSARMRVFAHSCFRVFFIKVLSFFLYTDS